MLALSESVLNHGLADRRLGVPIRESGWLACTVSVRPASISTGSNENTRPCPINSSFEQIFFEITFTRLEIDLECLLAMMHG